MCMTEPELQAVERMFAVCKRRIAERRGETLERCAECAFVEMLLDCLNETAGDALAEYLISREHSWDDRYGRL